MRSFAFRPLIAAIARRFPPKHAADRVLPWTALLAAVVGASAAIWQYGNDLAIERSKTTLEMHKQFRASYGNWSDTLLMDPEGKDVPFEMLAVHILRIRCNAYAAALTAGTMQANGMTLPICAELKTPDWVLLDQFGPQVKDPLRQTIREQVARFMVTGASIRRVRFFDVARYLRALLVCVEQRNCDTQTAIALFAHEITGFLNAACPYAEILGPEGTQEIRFLASYLIEEDVREKMHWSTDAGRKNLFVCPFLRELESAAAAR